MFLHSIIAYSIGAMDINILLSDSSPCSSSFSGTNSTPKVAPSSWLLQSCAKEVTWKIAHRRT